MNQKSHQSRHLKGARSQKEFRRKLKRQMTRAEHLLWLQLKNRNFKNLKFRRQHGIGPYIVDFYCAEKHLVIEVDGDIHAETEQIQKDKFRENYLKNLNLHIIRVFNNDIYANMDGVLEYLNEQT